VLRHKALFAFLFFAALVWPLSSATLNFMVVETGPPRESPSGDGPPAVFESSALWEDCLLDLFFEAGHIVSNSPILRLAGLSAADFPGSNRPAGNFPPEILPEMEAAALGGADYLILALLVYPPGAAGPKAKPEEVNLRVYSFSSREGPGLEEGPFTCRLVYEGGAPLNPSPEAPPEGNRPGGPAWGEEGGKEIERDRAKRLIRGLVPHIKD
jgi:hypothetical protein